MNSAVVSLYSICGKTSFIEKKMDHCPIVTDKMFVQIDRSLFYVIEFLCRNALARSKSHLL